MAQLTYVGQGQLATFGPLLSTVMLFVSLVLALLGIKFWGFRRRLTFDRAPAAQQTQQQSPSQQTPRYAAYESQVNGTDNAVHGVFRQRNTEEFESIRPTNSAASKYLTGSVPNLSLASLTPREHKEVPTIPELDGTVPYRSGPEPQAARRRRREVYSANYEHYATPPTREPPTPPGASVAAAPPSLLPAAEPVTEQLDMPNFDHFAEKYELISAKTTGSGEPRESQQIHKQNGRYVKYEQVDDVPELLTPDDDQTGAPISVAAMVHHVPQEPQQEPQSQLAMENEFQLKLVMEPKTIQTIQLPNDQLVPLEHTDSAFVVEIIAGTPDAIEQTEPVIAPKLFDDLELTSHQQDPEFELMRSSYEMNEADILDIQPDFSGLQLLQPRQSPSSPPGFGKSIDEDWENFENLDHVTDLPEPNWSVHPAMLESPLQEDRETNLELENVVQQETLFQQIELMEPATEGPQSEPPPYEARLPPPPILPDYESLMQQEKSKTNRNLPKYADVVGQPRANGARFVRSIEDLFGELQINGETTTENSTQVRNFEELCEELEIAPSPVPERRAPQPAPRVSKPATLNARGDAPPLTCYEREELPNSSSSEEETVETTSKPQPQPAKRQRHVRFDVENLQYYQSAEVPSSNESEADFQSADESESELPPRPTQRIVTLTTAVENNVPILFGTQVSQEESDDDEAFGRAIRQHRTMTEALRPVIQLDRNSDRGTEA